MPIQFWNNKILFVDGKIAMDPRCCCGPPAVCGCSDGICCWSNDATVKFTIDLTWRSIGIIYNFSPYTGTFKWNDVARRSSTWTTRNCNFSASTSGYFGSWNPPGPPNAEVTGTLDNPYFDHGTEMGGGFFADFQAAYNTTDCPGKWRISGGILFLQQQTSALWHGCVDGDCSGFTNMSVPAEGQYYGEGSGSANVSLTATTRCCRDLAGRCVPGTPNTNGSCLIAPLSATAIDADLTVAAPVWHIRRAAELNLPAEMREAFIAECMAAAEVVGDTYLMRGDRYMALGKKWGPKSRGRKTPDGNIESVETLPCNNCGGGNAVRDVAMARTPAEMERAILEA